LSGAVISQADNALEAAATLFRAGQVAFLRLPARLNRLSD